MTTEADRVKAEGEEAAIASGNGGEKKRFLGADGSELPQGYKVVRTRSTTVEKDGLGRRIVEDNVEIKDKSLFVHRSDAVRTGASGDVDREVGTRATQTRSISGKAQPTPSGGRSGGGISSPANSPFKASSPRIPAFIPNRPAAAAPGIARSSGQNNYDPFRTEQIDDAIPVEPMYEVGREHTPTKTMDPPTVAAFQREMVAAGVLPKSFKNFGTWDKTSITQYRTLLGYANQAGVDDREMMARWKQYGLGASDVPGKVLTVSSPDQIKGVLKQSSAQIIGRTLSEAEMAKLVAGYQDLERSHDEANAAAELAAAQTGEDQVLSAVAPMEQYAENQLRTQYKGEADWKTANSRMQQFYSILGEGGGMGGLG